MTEPAFDAAFGVLGVIAGVLGAYLVVAVVLSVLAELVEGGAVGRGAARLRDLVVLPQVRRAVSLVLGASVAGVIVVPAPARADDSPPTLRRLPDAEVMADEQLDAGPEPPAPEVPVSEPPVPEPQATWVLAPGEHLWAVAEATLTRSWPRPPTTAEVGAYWAEVVEANRSSLADPANPDLVFVGQVVTLPPVPQPAPA